MWKKTLEKLLYYIIPIILLFLVFISGIIYDNNKNNKEGWYDLLKEKYTNTLDSMFYVISWDIQLITGNFEKTINRENIDIYWHNRIAVQIPFSARNGNSVKLTFRNANVGTDIWYYNPTLKDSVKYQPYQFFGLNPWDLLEIPQKNNTCFFLTTDIWLEKKFLEMDSKCNIIPVSKTSDYPVIILFLTFFNKDIDFNGDTSFKLDFLWNIFLSPQELTKFYNSN